MIETAQDDGQLLQSVYALISHVVCDPENGQLDQATRTSAWTVRELLFHLLLDAQRALVAFPSPTHGPADVDNVTYWRPDLTQRRVRSRPMPVRVLRFGIAG